MLKRDKDELRILRSLGIAIVEALSDGEPIRLTPAIGDVLVEWLGHPNARQDATVLELVDHLNSQPEVV